MLALIQAASSRACWSTRSTCAIADGKADELVIARAREPVPGEDGELESLLPEARERVPSVSASGRTDYRDLGEVQIVRAGDALMRRHPPTRGIEA